MILEIVIGRFFLSQQDFKNCQKFAIMNVAAPCYMHIKIENFFYKFLIFFVICRRVSKFIMALYEVYKRQYFTYMEINPLVVTDTAIYILDFAAKVGWFFANLLWKFRERLTRLH